MGRLLLAPMEGLADCVLRDVLTGVGGYDGAVTEFVRVSGTLLPEKTFRRICPELDYASRTRSGTPVVVQLLGSDPQCLAENAARLATLAPAGIDLNFGCPAPAVNRHGGGATLLDDPEQLARIVRAVRRAVPQSIPVSAKMRLGVADTSKAIACAQALESGGIASLVVHARTRIEGYRPPAHWEWIARIAAAITVPVIANGEVWTVDDWRRCRSVSACHDVMLGRGAVADPWLALRIKGTMDEKPAPDDWHALLPLIFEYWEQVLARLSGSPACGRLKLLLSHFQRTWPEAVQLYGMLRTISDPREISQRLEAARRGHGQAGAVAWLAS